MNIKYEINPSLDSDEVIIVCKEVTSSIIEMERLLQTHSLESIFGLKDNKIYPIKPTTIERIYVENRKTMFYSRGEVYSTKNTLSELETTLGTAFVRISKSVIANIKHIKSMEPEFSGNFTLTFLSGTKETLSRTYVKSLKQAIGLER